MEKDLFERIKRDLKVYEGFKAHVYLCSAGKKTIGHGHNIESKPIKISGVWLDKDYVIDNKPIITLEEADKVLSDDIKDAEDGAVRLFNEFYSYPDCVQYVIVSMVFQLGQTSVNRFQNMCKAIKERLWKKAMYEALDSKWHREDTFERSLKVCFNFIDYL